MPVNCNQLSEGAGESPFVTKPALMELPRVTEPISAPATLQTIVEEYNAQPAAGLLRDALGYLARYYTGVCVAACRELDCLPGEVAQNWSGPPSIELSLPILHNCLERLRPCEQRLARKLVQVFYEQDGQLRSFALSCFGNAEFQVADFCSTARDRVDGAPQEQLETAARLVDTWISASFSFFLEAEHRLETGPYFGQLEQVVCFEQFTLRSGLTMRVHESRGLAPLPALAPDSVPLESQPDGELEPQPTAMPLAQVGETPMLEPPRPVMAESLVKFLEDKQRHVPAGPVRTPLVARPDQEPRLEVRLEPLGFARNSRGKIGYGGFLWVESNDGDPITGTVTATGGTVDITPPVFEGATTRITYWVHPDDVASSKHYLKVSSDGESRMYGLWRLAPPSRFESFTRRKLAGLLLLPGLLSVLYSAWILFITERTVERQVRAMLGNYASEYLNPEQPLSLKQAGIGQLDVTFKPQMESAALIFLLAAWVTPVVVARLYARYPRRDQRPLVLFFMLGCCLPLLGYLALWNTPLTQGVLTLHPELAQIDFRRSFLAFAAINLGTSLYVVLSVAGFFHRMLNELGRFALASLGVAGVALVVLLQVYGLSWFS